MIEGYGFNECSVLPPAQDEGSLIDVVPDEVMQFIFSLISRDLSAICNISLVCKKWSRIVLGVNIFFPRMSCSFFSLLGNYKAIAAENAPPSKTFAQIPNAFISHEPITGLDVGKPCPLECAVKNGPGPLYIKFFDGNQTVCL